MTELEELRKKVADGQRYEAVLYMPGIRLCVEKLQAVLSEFETLFEQAASRGARDAHKRPRCACGKYNAGYAKKLQHVCSAKKVTATSLKKQPKEQLHWTQQPKNKARMMAHIKQMRRIKKRKDHTTRHIHKAITPAKRLSAA